MKGGDILQMYETRQYPGLRSRLFRTSALEVSGFVVDSARLHDVEVRRLLLPYSVRQSRQACMALLCAVVAIIISAFLMRVFDSNYWMIPGVLLACVALAWVLRDSRRVLLESVMLKPGPQRVSAGDVRAIVLGNSYFSHIVHTGNTWQKSTDFSRSITLEHPLSYIVDDCSKRCEWTFSLSGVMRCTRNESYPDKTEAARLADAVIAEFYSDAQILQLCGRLPQGYENSSEDDTTRQLAELARPYVTRLQYIRDTHRPS